MIDRMFDRTSDHITINQTNLLRSIECLFIHLISQTNSLGSIGCLIKSLISLKFDRSFDPIMID
jgi:hypothetical protein